MTLRLRAFAVKLPLRVRAVHAKTQSRKEKPQRRSLPALPTYRNSTDSIRIVAMSNPQPAAALNLRPATPEDSAFLIELYKSSRGDDLRGLGWEEARINQFLDMQYDAQKRFHANEYKHAVDRIVLREDEPVGRLMFEAREHEIRCIDIAIAAAHRNQGIGAQVVHGLQEEAKRQKKPVRLQVIRFSRAVPLFERLGFQRISETGTHFQMEWTPE
jgi:GNAT superfamily N-acetyltransferase